jgi:hypothetical protein
MNRKTQKPELEIGTDKTTHTRQTQSVDGYMFEFNLAEIHPVEILDDFGSQQTHCWNPNLEMLGGLPGPVGKTGVCKQT